MDLLWMRLSFNIFKSNFICSDFHSIYSDFHSINSKKMSLQHILCIFEILMRVKLMTVQCHEIGQCSRQIYCKRKNKPKVRSQFTLGTRFILNCLCSLLSPKGVLRLRITVHYEYADGLQLYCDLTKSAMHQQSLCSVEKFLGHGGLGSVFTSSLKLGLKC